MNYCSKKERFSGGTHVHKYAFGCTCPLGSQGDQNQALVRQKSHLHNALPIRVVRQKQASLGLQGNYAISAHSLESLQGGGETPLSVEDNFL